MEPLYQPVRNIKPIQDVAVPTVGQALAHKANSDRMKLNSAGKITRVRAKESIPQPAKPHIPAATASALAVAMAGKINDFMNFFKFDWLPKKYTAKHGLTTDWHVKAFAGLKFAVPSLVVLYAAMICLLAWPITPLTDTPNVKYTRDANKIPQNSPAPTQPSQDSTQNSTSRSVYSSQDYSSYSATPSVATNPQNVTASGGTDTPPAPVVPPTPSETTPGEQPAEEPSPSDSEPPVVIDVPELPLQNVELQLQLPGLTLDI